MKKTIRVVSLLAAVFLIITGCDIPYPVISLNSIFTRDAVVFEERLLGSWTVDDWPKGQTKITEWLFEEKLVEIREPSSGFSLFGGSSSVIDSYKGYTITIVSQKGRKDIFDAWLLKLGENHFLEIYPANETKDSEGWLVDGLYPVRQVWKISWRDNIITLSGLSYKWLWDQRGRLNVDTKRGDDFLFISPTNIMQAFLKEYGGDEKAFLVVAKLYWRIKIH